MADPIIKIEGMNKWFGDFQVLKNLLVKTLETLQQT